MANRKNSAKAGTNISLKNTKPRIPSLLSRGYQAHFSSNAAPRRIPDGTKVNRQHRQSANRAINGILDKRLILGPVLTTSQGRRFTLPNVTGPHHTIGLLHCSPLPSCLWPDEPTAGASSIHYASDSVIISIGSEHTVVAHALKPGLSDGVSLADSQVSCAL